MHHCPTPLSPPHCHSSSKHSLLYTVKPVYRYRIFLPPISLLLCSCFVVRFGYRYNLPVGIRFCFHQRYTYRQVLLYSYRLRRNPFHCGKDQKRLFGRSAQQGSVTKESQWVLEETGFKWTP
ncbi:hypothetical protein CPB86DRAFT_357893 [Serendipita vermifera]|nr:hypothetical protein CPB86DRAFT_357893 [Serendipita vermifera]